MIHGYTGTVYSTCTQTFVVQQYLPTGSFSFSCLSKYVDLSNKLGNELQYSEEEI